MSDPIFDDINNESNEAELVKVKPLKFNHKAWHRFFLNESIIHLACPEAVQLLDELDNRYSAEKYEIMPDLTQDKLLDSFKSWINAARDAGTLNELDHHHVEVDMIGATIRCGIGISVFGDSFKATRFLLSDGDTAAVLDFPGVTDEAIAEFETASEQAMDRFIIGNIIKSMLGDMTSEAELEKIIAAALDEDEEGDSDEEADSGFSIVAPPEVEITQPEEIYQAVRGFPRPILPFSQN